MIVAQTPHKTSLEIIVEPRRSIRASYTDPDHAARDAAIWRKVGVHPDRIRIDGLTASEDQ